MACSFLEIIIIRIFCSLARKSLLHFDISEGQTNENPFKICYRPIRERGNMSPLFFMDYALQIINLIVDMETNKSSDLSPLFCF